MSALRFLYRHRVTYSECTLGNHVYYGRYLEMFEQARGEFFRSLGQPFAALQERETIFPVTEVTLRYQGAARYDDEVLIEITVEDIGKVRLVLRYQVFNGTGTLLVEGGTIQACTTLLDKPQRIPEELVSVLTPYRCEDHRA